MGVTSGQGGPCWVRCRATHFRPTYGRRHPCPWVSGHGSLRNLPRVLYLVALSCPMKQFEGTVHGADGKPLQIAGKPQHLDIQWDEARGRASFIVIVGLELPPFLIGMDIMRPLRVHIDITNGTATPGQPDPQTVHLNAAQSHPQPPSEPPSLTAGPPPAPQPLGETPSPRASLSPGGTTDPSSTQPQRQKIPLSGARSSALPPPEIPPPATARTSETLPSAPLSPAPPCTANPHTASCARLLQTADIPPQTARLVRCHNPWPTEDVLFCPNDGLPAFVTGIPALSSGTELGIATAQSLARASPASLRAKHRRPRGSNSCRNSNHQSHASKKNHANHHFQNASHRSRSNS